MRFAKIDDGHFDKLPSIYDSSSNRTLLSILNRLVRFIVYFYG